MSRAVKSRKLGQPQARSTAKAYSRPNGEDIEASDQPHIASFADFTQSSLSFANIGSATANSLLKSDDGARLALTMILPSSSVKSVYCLRTASSRRFAR